MPPFSDDNTLEDIEGCIAVAQGWPEYSDPDDPPIAVQLDEIIERIEEKLRRNSNRIRHNWFSIALAFAREARDHYVADDADQGCSLLQQCRDHLVSGNKAHRRKTAFLVGPDGVAHPTPSTKTQPTDEPHA